MIWVDPKVEKRNLLAPRRAAETAATKIAAAGGGASVVQTNISDTAAVEAVITAIQPAVARR